MKRRYAFTVIQQPTLKPLPALFLILFASWTVHSQTKQADTAKVPRFEDFSVTDQWDQIRTPLKLTTPSERMFRTNLSKAAKELPNFAGHYRITYWGCGSVCSAGALVDLQTGDVFQLPLAKANGRGWERWIMCEASFEGTNDEFHLDSRLIIVRCGLNYSERLRKNIPDTYYFLWEKDHFRQLLYISGKQLASGTWAIPTAATVQGDSVPAPKFRDYQVNEVFNEQPTPPVPVAVGQKRYRTRISNGVSKGEGVWTGSWRNPIRSAGPNFAGHYFVVRWGCGSDCLMIAIVDARTGKVYNPPLSGAGTELYVPMDILGDREIDFEPQSSLMILRNACKVARSECGVYYFDWRDEKFTMVGRTLVDLTQKW